MITKKPSKIARFFFDNKIITNGESNNNAFRKLLPEMS